MLKQIVRTILVAAAMTGGALAVTPAAVAAPVGVTVTAGQGGTVLLAQRYDRRDRYERRGCSAREALRKASRMGINRAGIVRDNRRAVVVDGRKRGRYITVRFAQARGCPVINVR